jgi:hypothetical protein
MPGNRKRGYRASLMLNQRFHLPSRAGGLGDLSPSINRSCGGRESLQKRWVNTCNAFVFSTDISVTLSMELFPVVGRIIQVLRPLGGS